MDKVQEFHKRIKEIHDDLKAHAQVTDDPKCVALCETSGEVVGGLEQAFDHYINKSEKA